LCQQAWCQQFLCWTCVRVRAPQCLRVYLGLCVRVFTGGVPLCGWLPLRVHDWGGWRVLKALMCLATMAAGVAHAPPTQPRRAGGWARQQGRRVGQRWWHTAVSVFGAASPCRFWCCTASFPWRCRCLFPLRCRCLFGEVCCMPCQAPHTLLQCRGAGALYLLCVVVIFACSSAARAAAAPPRLQCSSSPAALPVSFVRPDLLRGD